MRRAVELAVFLSVAAAVHLAVAAVRPPGEGADAAGAEGQQQVALQASTRAVSKLVEAWEAPPKVETPDPAPMAPPETPVREAPKAPAPTAPERPKAPDVAGLAVPDHADEADVDTAPPAPPPEPEPEIVPQTREADVPGTRPTARPEDLRRAAEQRQQQRRDRQREAERRERSSERSSPAQVASGEGGGAQAGRQAQSEVSTLSESQRQSLAARWGARLRAQIERRKRYPAAADGAAGTVTVRISVGRGGALAGVTVVRSSGNAALDRAALDAVRTAGRFPAAPQGLSEASYSFTLPMRFTS